MSTTHFSCSSSVSPNYYRRRHNNWRRNQPRAPDRQRIRQKAQAHHTGEAHGRTPTMPGKQHEENAGGLVEHVEQRAAGQQLRQALLRVQRDG
mmetsp:Transcript_14288/g.26752  ORF Transcript_14288/g.26752 Transcript_14288/m.26752 type:complete len:93 (-) Transcript_14288:179-457(-)